MQHSTQNETSSQARMSVMVLSFARVVAVARARLDEVLGVGCGLLVFEAGYLALFEVVEDLAEQVKVVTGA